MKQKINAMIMAGLIFIQGFVLYNKVYNSEINGNYESETAVIMAEETEAEQPETSNLVTDHYELYLATRELVTETEAEVIPEIEPSTEAPVFESYSLPLSDYEINLISLVTMAEAEGEPDNGKRLVIDTILNRVDSPVFPNSVHEVIYQPEQFSSMWNGRVDVCYVKPEIRQLVIDEIHNRYNYDVIFFRTLYFASYGKPLFQVGNHYFNSL